MWGLLQATNYFDCRNIQFKDKMTNFVQVINLYWNNQGIQTIQ